VSGKRQYIEVPYSYKQAKVCIMHLLEEGFYKEVRFQHSLFQKLYAQYPDLNFWTHWTPGFKLKSLVWFKGADGQRALDDGWHLFHFQMKDISKSNTPVDPSCGLDELFSSDKVVEQPLVSQDDLKKALEGCKQKIDIQEFLNQ
jgi:hypothetical protein